MEHQSGWVTGYGYGCWLPVTLLLLAFQGFLAVVVARQSSTWLKDEAPGIARTRLVRCLAPLMASAGALQLFLLGWCVAWWAAVPEAKLLSSLSVDALCLGLFAGIVLRPASRVFERGWTQLGPGLGGAAMAGAMGGTLLFLSFSWQSLPRAFAGIAQQSGDWTLAIAVAAYIAANIVVWSAVSLDPKRRFIIPASGWLAMITMCLVMVILPESMDRLLGLGGWPPSIAGALLGVSALQLYPGAKQRLANRAGPSPRRVAAAVILIMAGATLLANAAMAVIRLPLDWRHILQLSGWLTGAGYVAYALLWAGDVLARRREVAAARAAGG